MRLGASSEQAEVPTPACAWAASTDRPFGAQQAGRPRDHELVRNGEYLRLFEVNRGGVAVC
jgi:hypothetical protein